MIQQITKTSYALVIDEQREEKHANQEREQIDHAQNNRVGFSGFWSVYRHFSRWPDFA
jgi:hypothetical protein